MGNTSPFSASVQKTHETQLLSQIRTCRRAAAGLVTDAVSSSLQN